MDEIKLDAAEYGSNIIETRGREYIKYTNDPELAIEFVLKNLENKV